MESHEVSLRVKNLRLQQKLDWYESEIEKRGKALASIFIQLRDDKEKPYLRTHANWEDYCQGRWNMTPRRILQIVAADNVRQLLAYDPETAAIAPAMNEGQLRALSTVPPEKRIEVLKEAKKAPKLTARTIKEAKARIIPSTKPAKPPTPPEQNLDDEGEPARILHARCPHCGRPMPG